MPNVLSTSQKMQKLRLFNDVVYPVEKDAMVRRLGDRLGYHFSGAKTIIFDLFVDRPVEEFV